MVTCAQSPAFAMCARAALGAPAGLMRSTSSSGAGQQPSAGGSPSGLDLHEFEDLLRRERLSGFTDSTRPGGTPFSRDLQQHIAARLRQGLRATAPTPFPPSATIALTLALCLATKQDR